MHKKTDLIADVEWFVYEHMNEKITLEMFAEACHLSKYHFSREFKKGYGISPKVFVTNIKMQRARELLIETDLRIYEVAEHIGYETGRFCNLFREKNGVSPGVFREKHSKKRLI